MRIAKDRVINCASDLTAEEYREFRNWVWTTDSQGTDGYHGTNGIDLWVAIKRREGGE
jgi:hypothetical protein